MKKLICIFVLNLFLSTSLVQAATPTAMIRNGVIRNGGLSGGGVPPAPVDPCTATPAPSAATECPGGALYAGTYDPLDGGGTKRYMTTAAGGGSMAWSSSSQTTSATSQTDGATNTTKILAIGATQLAGYYCGTLDVHGYDDWFLPAPEELRLINTNRAAFGISDGSYFWTSQENTRWNAEQFLMQNSPWIGGEGKSTSKNIRCVRKY